MLSWSESAGPPTPTPTSHSLREEGQEAGSHRVPQISEANMTRAQKQSVMSLEGQNAVSRAPCGSPGTSAFQQQAALRLPDPVLHPQTLPSFPHWVSGTPYLTGHEQEAHHS